jgi:hypothetical protein
MGPETVRLRRGRQPLGDSSPPSGPGEACTTAQGHPRAIFQRAIECGNLLVAQNTLREIGRVTLVEALQLTALIAVKDPRRHARVSARWLARSLEERDQATIDEAAAGRVRCGFVLVGAWCVGRRS